MTTCILPTKQSLLMIRYSPRLRDTGRTISATICGCGRWRQDCRSIECRKRERRTALLAQRAEIDKELKELETTDAP